MPQGPCRLGPMRSCIQATTLRSQTMENSTVTIRNAKQKTALTTTSHQGSRPNMREVLRGEVRRSCLHHLRGGLPRRAGPMRTTCAGDRARCRRRRRRRRSSAAARPPGRASRVTCSGSWTLPAGPVTASRSPSLTPASAAVAAESRATAACRVPASASSPSWSEPWSSSSRCPASTASPVGGPGQRLRASPAGSVARGPSQAPSRSSSRAYGADVGQRRGARPSASASMCSTRASGGRRRAGQLVGLERGLEQPRPALPVEEGAGLLGDRGDREAPRRRAR